MDNDDIFRSLSNMVEEYNRLVSPLTEQFKIVDKWNETFSPILRVAQTYQDVLDKANSIGDALATRISELTTPYQEYLNNMTAIANMLKTPFSEVVKPQVYLPDLISEATHIGSIVDKVANTAQITQIGQALSNAAISAQTAKMWQIDLSQIAAFETTGGTASPFDKLIEAEKIVAESSYVVKHYNQITSVSAQLASIQQIGLTDTWKNAITPPDFLLGLNDFALKQYTEISNDLDDASIAWRLGLVDIAASYVDEQIKWGAELAIDSDVAAPETEMKIPDFSELPQLLGYAKRDKLDVEEAFNESQFVEITGLGRLIIEKAKLINERYKLLHNDLLFPEANLVNWAMCLSSAYCRSADTLDDVLDTLIDMFYRKPITDLIGNHSCVAELIANRNTNERKKGKISRIQRQIYYQIIKAEELIEEKIGSISTTIYDENTISSNILKALLNIQSDSLYIDASENSINDGIRNQLSMIYDVKDQTRCGVSVSGKNAGEIDVMISDNGNPIAILEGLILDCLSKDYLRSHINKAISNYNPMGCTLVYILIYAKAKDFESFWNKFMDYMKDYEFPYDTDETVRELNTPYTESRHAKTVLNRNGKKVHVHFYAIVMG